MPPSVEESLRVPVARDQWQAVIESAADPDRTSQYFDELLRRHPTLHQSLTPEHLQIFSTVFSLSRFLSEEVLRQPDWVLDLSRLEETLSVEDYRNRLEKFLGFSSEPGATALHLALFRRRELVRILVRDASGAASLAAITEEISNLADAIVDCALARVTQELEQRHGSPLLSDNGARAGFAVLALGKLGGRELNYSSDIDLLFLYGGNGETDGAHVITNKEFFTKVANQLTNLLSTYTATGTCYRVDLRLRPEGTLGEICASLEGAKEYYSKRARDWELQMLIKARPAAGDLAVGQALLHFVHPFIYSTTLDFSTVENVSVTRERLSEKLARKRLKRDQLDVKLAPGGIRDIEFLAQCLQRLHGARDWSVRHTGTLFALSSLLNRDMLSETEHGYLTEAYQFLRHLEHRLQFEEDRQTHTLPSNPLQLERVARRMPVPSGAPRFNATQLLSTLNAHLEHVQVIYERIVHAQRPLAYAPHGSESGPFPLAGSNLVSHPGVSPALPSSLLNSASLTADYTRQIFDLSPFLAEQLSRQPELLDEISALASNPGACPAFEGLAAPLNDIEGLHRFYAREMFRIIAASICLPQPVFQTLDRASGLAEFVIARAYRVALDQALAYARARATLDKPFRPPQEQMMVVALGRLGMREFDLGSDADLLFIIPDGESERQRFWTRVAERMIEMLTTYRGNAPMLSLDTRLRPNGREGLLVQNESAYVEYFATKAEAWEGIAYMKARAVAGDSERATSFLTRLQQLDWRRYGQSGRSRRHLRQMRLRLEREQGAMAPLKAARGGYYDADFILMYLRLRGAGMFFKSLNTPERIDVVEKMGHLEREDADLLMNATTFFRAVDHASRVVLGRAEDKLPDSAEQRELAARLVQRWTGTQATGYTLVDELASLQAKLRHLFDAVFH